MVKVLWLAGCSSEKRGITRTRGKKVHVFTRCVATNNHSAKSTDMLLLPLVRLTHKFP